jgi:ER membrane protein complex subunit 3
VLTGVLRHYATVMLAATPKPLDAKAMREQRSLLHGVNVRTNYHTLSKRSFLSRREALVSAYESGAYLKEPERRGQAPPNPMTDPNAMEGMMGMMKNNMAMIIPNTLIMSWINAFFSGYVISEHLPSSTPRPSADRDFARSETTLPLDHQV